MTRYELMTSILFLLVTMLIPSCCWMQGDYFTPNSESSGSLRIEDSDEDVRYLNASINSQGTYLENGVAKFEIDILNESETVSVKLLSAEIRYSRVHHEYCFIEEKHDFEPSVEVLPKSKTQILFNLPATGRSQECDLSKMSKIEYELNIIYQYGELNRSGSLVFRHQVIKRLISTSDG